MFIKIKITVAASLLFALATQAAATGFTVAAVPESVDVEGNRVFISGNFINPDGCAISTVVVLTPNSPEELNRMLSVALTALASGKRLSMYLNGCTPVPWAASAPQAVTTAILK